MTMSDTKVWVGPGACRPGSKKAKSKAEGQAYQKRIAGTFWLNQWLNKHFPDVPVEEVPAELIIERMTDELRELQKEGADVLEEWNRAEAPFEERGEVVPKEVSRPYCQRLSACMVKSVKLDTMLDVVDAGGDTPPSVVAVHIDVDEDEEGDD